MGTVTRSMVFLVVLSAYHARHVIGTIYILIDEQFAISHRITGIHESRVAMLSDGNLRVTQHVTYHTTAKHLIYIT